MFRLRRSARKIALRWPKGTPDMRVSARFSGGRMKRRRAVGESARTQDVLSDPRVACGSSCGSVNVLRVLLLLRWGLLPMIGMFTVITVLHHHLGMITMISTVFLFVSVYLGIHWFTRSDLKIRKKMALMHWIHTQTLLYV